MKTVLLVDNDLGFAFWLGQVLDAADYEALPAKNVQDAFRLLAELECSVDLLILNPSLPGSEGFIRAMRQLRPDLKVLAVTSDEAKNGMPVGIDASREKPVRVNEDSQNEWVYFIRKVLAGSAVAL